MLYRFLLLALPLTSAFLMPPPPALLRTPPLQALITEKEAAAVLAKAQNCLDEECSVDSVNDLLVDLRGQKRVLQMRLEEISELIVSLTAANLVEESASGGGKTATRDVDEIAKSIESLAQVFRVSAKSSGNDYPALAFPMGFTGTPNKDKKKL